MISLGDVSGLVLAGGQGRRMQQAQQPAAEKGLLLLHGKPLIAWAICALPSGLAHTYVSANRCRERYADYGIVVPDAPSFGAGLGPLAGIASAMQKSDTQWLYVVPADVPGPPPGLCQRLLQHLNEHGGELAYACSDQPQPLFMLVNTCLLDSLEDYLRRGCRQVRLWQREYGQAVHIDAGNNEFFNINTPDDLRLAHQLIPVSSL